MLVPSTVRGRTLSLVLAALLMSGCSSWRLQEGPPSTLVDGETPWRAPVRVTLSDGQRLAMSRASVVGDSLVGVEGRRFGARRVKVALADIETVETQRYDIGKTALLLLAGGLVAIVIVGATWDGPLGNR